jgi:hypothetical protein
MHAALALGCQAAEEGVRMINADLAQEVAPNHSGRG